MRIWKRIRNLCLMICLSFTFTLFGDSNFEEKWDVNAEQLIVDVVNSSTYVNKEILYLYAGKQWNIRVINSPAQFKLFSNSAYFLCPFYLLTKEVVPDELFSHLIEIIDNYLTPISCERSIFRDEGKSSGGTRRIGSFCTYYFAGLCNVNHIEIGPVRLFIHNGKLSTGSALIHAERMFSNAGYINDITTFDFLEKPQVLPAD